MNNMNLEEKIRKYLILTLFDEESISEDGKKHIKRLREHDVLK